MQLQLNSCADQLALPICNQSSSNQCEGSPPAEQSSNCGAGTSSRVSIRNSDLMMLPSASREKSATVSGACTIRSWSNPGADLINDSLHAAVNRQVDSPLSSRPSRMIFSSTSCGAAADHERGGWSPRFYACSFCGREFNSAQALGGHMNIHRRDRARLRTSTSPASIPHDQADLPSILQIPIQYSAPSCSLYDSFDEAAFRDQNPKTAISSSLNITGSTTPNIIDIPATPTLISLLDGQPAALDPTLRAVQALATCPSISPEEKLAAPFAVPLVDLMPCSSSTSAMIRFSNEARSFFSNITPHASPLFVRPSLENSPLKHVEALNTCAGQASGSPDCCEAASRAQLIQFSHSKGGTKRAREDDAVDGATAKANSTAGQHCRQKRPSAEKFNSLHAARPFVRPSTPDVKGLLCLDLELRLGQSSSSDHSCDGAGACCCRPWTTATAAPRPPA